MIMTELNALGFYGKIRSNGDFVTRNLPRSFVEPWDQWLQESIASSHQQLGDQWLNNYLTGPIWRFALSKGVCGDNSCVGIVMPSVDSVGRYFPLTLAVPVNNSRELLFIADKEEPWFLQAEEIALSTLDQKNNLDSLTQDLDNLGVPNLFNVTSKTQQDDISKPDQSNNNNWRIDMSASEPISANLNSLMEELLLQRFPDFTLWWTSGSDHVEPSILICNKLPHTQGFSALLTGNWDHWGWDNKLSNFHSVVKINNGNATVNTS